MSVVAVLGAGLLGTGFIENLLDKGVSVRVWNRTASRLTALGERGAYVASSPADAVAGASRVHLILSEDAAVDATIEALVPSLGADVPIFDHSTNLPAGVAPRYERLRAAGVRYSHAPVFMGPANARAANGIMLLACPAAEAEAATPTLLTMTGKVWYVGERPDLAAVHKLLGNSLIISLAGALGDTIAIAQAQGLDGSAVTELLKNFNPGAMMSVMVQRIGGSDTSDASFTLEMARKDVRLMIETAGEGLQVLPAIAAAMDKAIGEGKLLKDFAIFAKRS